ncbi:MAG: type II toxin-antitoxin system HicB family antitoxin [bacterium]
MGPWVSMNRQFLVDLYLDDDAQRYTAVVPELPGCIAEGDNLTEARTLIIEAASLYLESLGDLERDLPRELAPPLDGYLPLHSLAVGLRDIAQAMDQEADHFLGSHVALSNTDSGQVVVFPMSHGRLSGTTIALLLHYAGVDAAEFLDGLTRRTAPATEPACRRRSG